MSHALEKYRVAATPYQWCCCGFIASFLWDRVAKPTTPDFEFRVFPSPRLVALSELENYSCIAVEGFEFFQKL